MINQFHHIIHTTNSFSNFINSLIDFQSINLQALLGFDGKNVE